MPKIRTIFIILLFSFPFLVSFDSNSKNRSISSYQTPEGILFVSYSNEWDQTKLIELYRELMLNKHGEEINQLQEIRIQGGKHSSSNTKGSFHPTTNTIILYQGDKYTDPADYRETLSHEYGHHFAYYHFPSHHFPFSKWQQLRGIDASKVRWDAFWNYEEKYHALYPQEIIADDYVLLYGATNKVNIKDIYTNEAFYLRTQHENQQLPNILENEKLLTYLEEETGVSIDKNRLFQTPTLIGLQDHVIRFSVSSKASIAYRLNLELVLPSNESKTIELYEITSEEIDNQIHFSLEDTGLGDFSDYDSATLSIDVVDLTTSIGFETEQTTLKF